MTCSPRLKFPLLALGLSVISTQVTLGAKRVIGQQVLLIGITESVANFDNSADIGFHVGLTRIF